MTVYNTQTKTFNREQIDNERLQTVTIEVRDLADLVIETFIVENVLATSYDLTKLADTLSVNITAPLLNQQAYSTFAHTLPLHIQESLWTVDNISKLTSKKSRIVDHDGMALAASVTVSSDGLAHLGSSDGHVFEVSEIYETDHGETYELDLTFDKGFSVTRGMSPRQLALFMVQKQLVESNDNRWTDWGMTTDDVLNILSRG